MSPVVTGMRATARLCGTTGTMIVTVFALDELCVAPTGSVTVGVKVSSALGGLPPRPRQPASGNEQKEGKIALHHFLPL